MENKSAGINALLMCLREDLGRENFDITDHWEGDELAIGISKEKEAGVFAYISVCVDKPLYYIALELPSETAEFESAGEFNELNYSELLPILIKHLSMTNC